MSAVKLETKLVNEISGRFFVPSYQRGYRWEKNEVERLLEDVYNLKGINGQPSQNYCLQPVVVKKSDKNYFEVIDGQQRLTTLFLIYNYMFEIGGNFFGVPKFSLEYETRGKSENFLANVNKNLNRREENIDFHFMANAYESIKNWFENKGEPSVTMPDMKTLFAHSVKIIWYEVDSSEDAPAMFARLNIGKIPLTNAELVKAMFLSRSNKKIDRRRQEEIALQWDNIEKELHNNSLWYFLTNNSPEKYQTRMDLVLDLISGKRINDRDKYSTFNYFNKLRENKNLELVWQEIVQTFLLLKDWRENHELYHKIGYLISSGHKNISNIYIESKNKTKKLFSSRLDELIKESIALKDGKHYSELTYAEDKDKELIRRILLLFNVESVRQLEKQSQWFPFDKFKFSDDGKISWSLEHIHAVQTQKGNQKFWREWLELHKKSLELLQDDNSDLTTEIEKLLALKNLTYEKFQPLQEKIIKKFSPTDENSDYIDSISNLALLKCEENSALGNSTFDVKRNSVIEMDMHGEFIPFCTKMAFLKYYTKSEQNQIHFWSQTDRESYLQAIDKVLKNYLAEPIKIN